MFELIKHFVILTWRELVDWIYLNNDSIGAYIVKVLIAFFIYIVASDIVKKIFRKAQKNMEKKEINKFISSYLIFVPMYMILSCMIITLFDHINKIEVSPQVTIVLFLFLFLILAVKGFFTRLITNAIRSTKRALRGDDDDVYAELTQIYIPRFITSKSIRLLIDFGFKLVCVAIASFLIYFSYQGIIYMIDTNGEEISYLFNRPDDLLAREMNTEFTDDIKLGDSMPVFTSGQVTAKTDGELNIVYVNNERVGFNTTGRDYKIFGISVNMTEISLKHRVTLVYDRVLHNLPSAYGGKSNMTYFVNDETGECLVVIISSSSNKVVSVSYFTDFDKVTEGITLTSE